jgi:hypothetical protein
MKRRFAICAIITCSLLACLAQGASITVATFADPAVDSTTPLFNVDSTGNTITGGWADSRTGLNLQVAGGTGSPFIDAWFTINTSESTTSAPLAIGDPQSMWGMYFGKTGAGVITFYKNGTTNKILKLAFDKAYVTPSSFGVSKALDPTANITITDYTGSSLFGTSGVSFSFGFVNIDNTPTGYNATASFSLSAIPEPTTIALLSIGALSVIRKRKVSL